MEFPVTFWIMVVLLSIGFIANIVSFAAPFWNEVETFHWGLWQMCAETAGCEEVSSEILTGAMQIGRGFITSGFILYVVVIIIVAVYKFWRDDIRLLTAACVTSFLTLLTLFLGAVLWMSSSNTTFSWCYYLCYASALLMSASGGIILYVRRYKRLKISNAQEQGNA